MKQFFIIALLFAFNFSTSIFSLDCPKFITLTFSSPKKNEKVNGAKQKVTLTTNAKGDFFYHLIQTNPSDTKKTQYLQSSGKVEGNSFSNYVWLGNESKGKNSSFVVTAVLSTKEIKKEGKVAIWNEKTLNPKETCITTSLTLNRTE